MAGRSPSAPSRSLVVLSPAPLAADGAGLAGRRDLRRRRRPAVRPRRQGRRDRRSDRQRAAVDRPAGRASAPPTTCTRSARPPRIMLVGFAEGLGAAKTYAARAHYEVDANRELIGLGAANIGSGLMSGMVVNGSLSKTAVNGSAGARSQVSGLVVAVLTVVTLLFLTPLFEDLPEATLAAVVIAAVVELVDIDALRDFYRLYSRAPGQHLRPGRPSRLHRRRRRDVRRARVRHPARADHRHRRVAAPPAVPLVAAVRRRARTRRRDGPPVRRHRAPPGERGRSGRRP